MLGSTARTDVLAREWDPDIVLFVGGAVNSAREMRRAAWSLESSGARIMLVPSLTEVAGDRIQVRPAAGLPMMELQGPASRGTSAALKRAFDVVVAALGRAITRRMDIWVPMPRPDFAREQHLRRHQQ